MAHGGAPGGGAPHGSYPPAERFTITFDPDKRHEYSAEHFIRDAKRYIQEIASGPNYTYVHRRRAIREALRGKAKKFMDEDVPELWLENENTTLDLEDGQGQVPHEPWEIILYIVLKNYGPDQLTKDLKDVDAFDDWKPQANQRMADIISDFESKRIKAASKGHTLSVPAFSKKFLKALNITAAHEAYEELLNHCADSLPTTEEEWKTLLAKLKKRDDRKRFGQGAKANTHLATYDGTLQSAFPTWPSSQPAEWPSQMPQLMLHLGNSGLHHLGQPSQDGTIHPTSHKTITRPIQPLISHPLLLIHQIHTGKI